MDSFSQRTIVVEDETSLEPVYFTLKWSIQHFEGLRKTEDYIYSTGITMAELGMEDNYQGRWRICVEPCYVAKMLNNSYLMDNYVSVFLSPTDEDLKSTSYTGQRPLACVYKLRVTTGKLMDVSLFSTTEYTTVVTFSYDKNIRSGNERSISHQDLFGSGAKALKDSCLNVVMDVIIYRDPKTTRISEAVYPSLPHRYQEYFGRLLKRREAGGDFLLVSNDRRDFHVDRFLLMAHSPVFTAMLHHNTKEKQTSRCELDDVDGECVEILLEYVYGCETKKIQGNNAEKVLMMAEQYQMTELRELCEMTLANNITVDNAVHFFVLARQLNLGSLKSVAAGFIRKNLDLETVLDESLQAI